MDKASLEEDDELQDRWASLLSNAADPHYKGLISTAFPDILSQMSKEEAIFLEKFYKQRDVTDEERKRQLVEEGINQVYLDNLVRLRLIEWFQPSDADGFRSVAEFYTTALGDAFIAACTTPKKKRRR